MPPIEFWFEFASTYSYPAAERIAALAAAASRTVVYRPFLLGPLFAGQGLTDSPFNVYPVKGRYMWRDLERTCAQHNLPFKRPSVFPRHSVLAARLTLVTIHEPWGVELVRRIYRANFAHDRDIANKDVLADLLKGLGADPGGWLARANDQETKIRLRDQTERAERLGIFGAPSFVVDGELFWGNDRLEQALDWQARG
jgi:2-hydroxychromene-2-carboxylate isomerase